MEPKEMVHFTTISGKMEEQMDPLVLENNDLKYFYHLCLGVEKGVQYIFYTFNRGSIIPLPSKIHSARWINTASAILRLYIQTLNPPEQLIRLVSIIVNWYGPMIFEVRTKPHIIHGAIHFYESISLARPQKNWRYSSTSLNTMVTWLIQSQYYLPWCLMKMKP